MTTKDQAITRFIEAVKLDQHDWEDWPEDSREAFIALQQPPAPDCRTCEYLRLCTAREALPKCTNGDKYQEATKVVLWRTE